MKLRSEAQRAALERGKAGGFALKIKGREAEFRVDRMAMDTDIRRAWPGIPINPARVHERCQEYRDYSVWRRQRFYDKWGITA